jgi:hypothetical protein
MVNLKKYYPNTLDFKKYYPNTLDFEKYYPNYYYKNILRFETFLVFFSFGIFIYFIYKISNNIFNIFSKYFNKWNTIIQDQKKENSDNYVYEDDLETQGYFNKQEYNINLNILNRLRELKENQRTDLQKLTKYKKDHNLDYKLYADIEPKILNSHKDEYDYKKTPSFFEYLSGLFSNPK